MGYISGQRLRVPQVPKAEARRALGSMVGKAAAAVTSARRSPTSSGMRTPPTVSSKRSREDGQSIILAADTAVARPA